jgi:uncharacterized repeat protein (TIGR03803 family)
MNFKDLMGRVWLFTLVLVSWAETSAFGLEPRPLVNFRVSLGTVSGNLVEGRDGNFYGTTTHGGPVGSGSIFSVTPSGLLTTLNSNLANPAAGLVVGDDGLLYGMTGAGGPFGWGTFFRTTTDGVVTNFAVLDGTNGGNPLFGLAAGGDGNFYGTSAEGGANGIGAVFKVTPNGVVTPLASFAFDANGAMPSAGLTLGPDGELYGITASAGEIGAGTIFKITTEGVLTTLHSFQFTDGFVHQAALTVGPDGNLYGTSRDGGTADQGSVFRITTNGDYATLASFAGTNGAVAISPLTVGADGQLYGATQLGGAANLGTIYKITTNGVLTTLASFTESVNALPTSGLLLASDGNFYGCTQGAIFKVSPEGSIAIVASLMPLDGINPQAGLTLGLDGNFYGTTRAGGSNNFGTIFRLTPQGSLTRLVAFNGTNGSFPQSTLTLGKDGNFYGTTTSGGSAKFFGTVFRFSTDGTLTTLASFDGTNSGSSPDCPLLIDTEGNLYGTAPQSGPGLRGTVFRVATNGVMTTLATFNGANGATPRDGLVMGDDGNFYGTTASGGANNLGTVYRLTPGGALTTIFSFNNTNGANPIGGLTFGKDGFLYGTTGFGGTNLGFGTIFKLSTSGDLTTLFNFRGTDGEEPSFRLIFGNDGKLYGTTSFGGDVDNSPSAIGSGSVFSITTNGIFSTLFLFHGVNGGNPAATLTLGPEGDLYGTAAQGGPGGGGTIFRVALAPRFASVANLPDRSLGLTATGPSGTSFRLWTSTNVVAPIQSWTMLTNAVFGAEDSFSYTDHPAVAVQGFYHLSVP